MKYGQQVDPEEEEFTYLMIVTLVMNKLIDVVKNMEGCRMGKRNILCCANNAELI